MEPDVSEIFSSFANYLRKDQELKEEIKNIVKIADQAGREVVTVLQVIHKNGSSNEIICCCKKAREIIEKEIKPSYQKLSSLFKPKPVSEYYRYHDNWKFCSQRMAYIIALIVYLESGNLVTHEDVAENLGSNFNILLIALYLKLQSSEVGANEMLDFTGKSCLRPKTENENFSRVNNLSFAVHIEQEEGFHLDLEDYLMGLLQLPSELTRLAVNSVVYGDYKRPIQISEFVAGLHAGFRLLNLKNDVLRKRFDALKYDVKKIEEVVYDLSIRGLKPIEEIANAEPEPTG